MKQPNSTVRFFGLDLSQVRSDWAIALSQLALWPVFRWLAPTYVTRIRMPDGQTADYLEKTGLALPKPQRAKTARYSGFLLPDKLVLWHPMLLPKLSADAAHAAMALEVRSFSPFLPDDLVWGHTPLVPEQRGNTVQLVIASRKLIAQHIATLEPTDLTQGDAEIWVNPPLSDGLMVLNGFGEAKRRRLVARWRVVNLCLVAVFATIGLAAAITPTAQLRVRAMQAAQDYAKLRALAAPAVRQRELLGQLDQQLKAIDEMAEPSLKPELILLRITQLLPDDTFITQLQAQGQKIMLMGQTPNTAALMQQLGAKAGIKNVRAPSGAVKMRGSERETFNIEFTLDSSSLTAQP